MVQLVMVICYNSVLQLYATTRDELIYIYRCMIAIYSKCASVLQNYIIGCVIALVELYPLIGDTSQ